MTSSKPWADSPFELISSSKSGDTIESPAKGARRLAAEMSLLHNCILRGLNAVRQQCVNVGIKGTAEDKLAFVEFAYRWGMMIEDHHHVEETLVFPDINRLAGEAGLMDGNVNEHRSFHEGLAEFSGYLDSVRKGNAEYDGERLKETIDSFGPILRTHLTNEIDTLLSLEKYEDKVDWGAWFNKKTDEIVDKAMKSAEYRSELFPLMIVFHDKTFEGGIWQNFPPIPWVFSLILKWLFMSTHKDWWRFAGCDFASTPKELPFA